MATTLTFDSLQADMVAYYERGTPITDPTVVNQIPRLINNAERRIAKELKVLGFLVPSLFIMIRGQAVYDKPDRWREIVSINYALPTLYTTASRQAAAGVRTLVFQKPHPFSVGSSIVVIGVGGSGYNSVVAGVSISTYVVTATTQLSVTYFNGATTEGLTADTGGVVYLQPNKRQPLFTRPYEYIRNYWPDDSVLGTPEFYADYDYGHWIMGPTPQFTVPAEFNYYEMPQLLDAGNQQNWVTEYAPELLLYASLLELAPFLKNDERIPTWQSAYDRAASGLSQQDIGRMKDRAAERNTE